MYTSVVRAEDVLLMFYSVSVWISVSFLLLPSAKFVLELRKILSVGQQKVAKWKKMRQRIHRERCVVTDSHVWDIGRFTESSIAYGFMNLLPSALLVNSARLWANITEDGFPIE